MTLVRPQGGRAAADGVAVRGCSQPTGRALRCWSIKSVALLGIVAMLGLASSASALILTGGPTYSLPGGGGCSVTGISSRTGGATITCTGVNLGAHTKVYFGLRNDNGPNGNTMTGVDPAASSADVFRFLSTGVSTITYTSSTTINDVFHGMHAVDSRLVLTRTGGSATVLSVGGAPGNNGNGDIDSVFQLTSGTSFTFRADVQASDSFLGGPGQACPFIYDPSHAVTGATGDHSRVDVAFYFSDCGDGQLDSPEQCDQGGANGTLGSCCAADCTFRPSGDVCRVGGGPLCDLSETCTGSNANCPPDDAIINGGNMLVCRPGSGDVCDQNEVCNGTPGVSCPPDDAPGNTTIVCRASSAGDICDMDEFCTGVPGQTCPPDDAPGQINVVCRPGSNDVCDPDERCTGNPGQGCPADIVSNPSIVCRMGSGDDCDPDETCTAIPGQPCPANVVAPSGTQCRAAPGACDVAEACTGVAGQTCPPDGFAPATMPCNVDGNVCTIDKCNGSGSCVLDSMFNCDDGNLCSQDSCNSMTGCVHTGTPSNNCVSASKALLKIKNAPNDGSDSVKFTWKGGPALQADLGDPTQTTRYELCIYDGSSIDPLQLAMGVPPGAGWTASPTGFKFKDASGQNQGVRIIKVKSSNLDRAKAKFAAKGGQMPDDAVMPFTYPVTAQLYASDGMCWEAQFGAPQTRTNTSASYKAKTP